MASNACSGETHHSQTCPAASKPIAQMYFAADPRDELRASAFECRSGGDLKKEMTHQKPQNTVPRDINNQIAITAPMPTTISVYLFSSASARCSRTMSVCVSYRIRETDRAATKVRTRPWRATREVTAVDCGMQTNFRERPLVERGAFLREKSPGVRDDDGEVDEK